MALSGGVKAEGLVKVYGGGVTALSAVSLMADAGEVVGVLGPNGAGKSTTLRILTTLLRPTRGRATVHGHDVGDVSSVRPLLGVALQEVGLDPLMSGNEHLAVQAALYGVSPERLREVRDPLIDRFLLSPYLEREVGAYSGGTQRKLALALALSSDPPVVVLDEPTAGLDPHSRRQVWGLVSDLRSRGKTVLFSTQYMDEAERLCDRIYVIDRGRIVAEGSPDELRTLVGEGTLRVLTDVPPAQLRELVADLLPSDGEGVEEDGETLVLRVPLDSPLPAEILLALQGDGVRVREFSLSPPTLEDTFIHLTGRALRPEPLGGSGTDVGLSMHRGGGARWR
jgi:ABC-2 type transport system ATP-binding protein